MISDEQLQEEIKKWRGQLSRGILELLILILLQRERYGWDILQLIRSLLPPSDPPIADGTIYNILNRLKKRELLSSENVVIEGRMRRYLKLTTSGIKLLNKMIEDWEQTMGSINEALEISK